MGKGDACVSEDSLHHKPQPHLGGGVTQEVRARWRQRVHVRRPSDRLLHQDQGHQTCTRLQCFA